MKFPEYSVLIAVYNSEKTLEELLRRIQAAFLTVSDDYEVILVDDGSRDRSWQVLERLQAKDARIKIIRLSRNFGQHKALMCGIQYCQGEYTLLLDDDLQDPPEELPKLIQEIQKDSEVDMICGKPSGKYNSWIRKTGGELYHFFQEKMMYGSSVRFTSCLIMRRTVAREIAANRSKNPLLSQIVFNITGRVRNIELRREARKQGHSGYGIGKIFSHIMDLLVNHSDLPLRLVSISGFASATISLLMILFYLHQYFTSGVGVSGWTTLVIINLFFPGLILLSFGVVGQYLIRIVREVNFTPQYVIRESKGI